MTCVRCVRLFSYAKGRLGSRSHRQAGAPAIQVGRIRWHCRGEDFLQARPADLQHRLPVFFRQGEPVFHYKFAGAFFQVPKAAAERKADTATILLPNPSATIAKAAIATAAPTEICCNRLVTR